MLVPNAPYLKSTCKVVKNAISQQVLSKLSLNWKKTSWQLLIIRICLSTRRRGPSCKEESEEDNDEEAIDKEQGDKEEEEKEKEGSDNKEPKIIIPVVPQKRKMDGHK